ncbi:MAG: calcium:proton antiporter [Vulcanococcus sp.]|uniref:calcium:proton antiporter n=1 Tax=Vulcanococcus sp. TaxID=2856995 RepID=UPI0025D9F906|nr:calcium:proton antiporter [Vulcanococcus sp.]MBW0168322.1 calcium:proton antiporter [Vulcanococcus sp.]
MLKSFFSLGRELVSSRWSLLLIFTAAALFAHLNEGMPIGQLIGWFIVCGLGLVPLSRMIAEMVEELADRLGDRIGGLVSVALGNLVELVVSFTALASGLYHLVVVSMAGAVITNCLLVLGISTCVGARKQATIEIHPYSTGLQDQQLLASAMFLAIPTIFALNNKAELSEGANKFDSFASYSLIVSVIVLAFYLLSFLYQMGTARNLYMRAESEDVLPAAGEKKPLGSLIVMLLVVSAILVGVSENLVESLEFLVEGAHLNPLFVGIFLLPLFGCFSEALISIKAANSNRMDLSMASTVESSVQLLLFVMPLLVICGIPMGRYLHLAIPGASLFCLGATVLAVHWIIENRKLSWYEGSLLLTLYCVIGAGTFFLGS